MKTRQPWKAAFFAMMMLGAIAIQSLAPHATGSLAQGPYSSMHMILKRTFLQVRAAQVDVRFDKATQSALKAIAAGQPYSDALADQVAKAVMGSQEFTIQMRFLRDVGFGEFVSGTRDNVACALKSGMISESEYQRVASGTPQWFAPVQKREFKEGDQVIYSFKGGTLTTLVRSSSGAILVKRTETGPDPRRTLLASYFAPCSDFREELIHSLFQTQH